MKIRGHHLLCIPRYYRGGYNREFAKQHKKVNSEIRKNPNIKLKVIMALDILCEKCPYKKGTICYSPEGNARVIELDKRVFKRLKIKKNSVHTAKDIFNLSMNKIHSIKGICNICTNYKWCLGGKSGGGINQSFKTDLNRK